MPHAKSLDNRKLSSNRSFGLIVFAILSVIGVFQLVEGKSSYIFYIIVSGYFLFFALIAPALLEPLNRLWFSLGYFLHMVINPVILAILFFGIFTPIGITIRLIDRKFFHLRFDPGAESYWIERVPHGPAPNSMANQF